MCINLQRTHLFFAAVKSRIQINIGGLGSWLRLRLHVPMFPLVAFVLKFLSRSVVCFDIEYFHCFHAIEQKQNIVKC